MCLGIDTGAGLLAILNSRECGMQSTYTSYDQLAGELAMIFDGLGLDQQHWIGLAGAPGSGKSTLAEAVRERLPSAITVIPMDGYHYYRHQLDAMEQPEMAHARRGAPFTFDAERLVDHLVAARARGQWLFPSFEHGKGDPVESGIELKAGRQIVIVEGNYLLLDSEPWSLLREQVFDDTWYLDLDLEECARRVMNRHVATGKSPEVAAHRVATNDRPNAELVQNESPKNAKRVIRVDSMGERAE